MPLLQNATPTHYNFHIWQLLPSNFHASASPRYLNSHAPQFPHATVSKYQIPNTNSHRAIPTHCNFPHLHCQISQFPHIAFSKHRSSHTPQSQHTAIPTLQLPTLRLPIATLIPHFPHQNSYSATVTLQLPHCDPNAARWRDCQFGWRQKNS